MLLVLKNPVIVIKLAKGNSRLNQHFVYYQVIIPSYLHPFVVTFPDKSNRYWPGTILVDYEGPL